MQMERNYVENFVKRANDKWRPTLSGIIKMIGTSI